MLECLLLTERERPSEWAEKNLIFPRETSGNAPGPLSFDRQPYLREILDCCADPTVQTVWVAGGAQIGKTATLVAMLGYMIAQQPSNGLWAMTNLDQVKIFSRKKVQPFIRANPCLARYIRQGDAAAMHPLNIDLTNMAVRFAGTGSPANLASESCAWTIGDEAAKWPHLNREEAHPIDLIQERTKAFPRRFHMFTSTPTTIDNEFWQGFSGSEMRQFFVPCPHCGERFAFMFSAETVRWEKPENGHMDIDLAAATVRYVCPHCRGEIWEEQKAAMLAAGEWRKSEWLHKLYASETVAPSKNSRGYHLDSLYSPFVSWGSCVRAFLECYTQLTMAIDLQNFQNSWKALPYERVEINIRNELVRALCSTHARGEVPGQPYYISVGYDPGADETHWVACAVYEGGVMRVIDWGTLLLHRSETHLENVGTEAEPEWVTRVDKAGIAPHFASLRWGSHVPACGFVDAGYNTLDIYDECAMLPGQLTPSKGSPTRLGTWALRTAAPSHPLQTVLTYCDHNAKISLYAETIGKKSPPALYLPRVDECDSELFRGLSGQKLVKRGRGEEWLRVKDDHFGDCIKIQRVAWWAMGREFEETAVLPAASENLNANDGVE